MQRLPIRRLYALIQGLPYESAATWRQERDKENEWTTQDELVATVIERIDLWGRINALAILKKSSIPSPVRIMRPGQDEPKTVEHDPRKIAAFFAEHFH